MDADAELWGVDPSQIENAINDDFAVWQDNLEALNAFLRISTQWNTIGVGMAGIFTVGLNYANAKAGLELAEIPVTPDLWDDILVIEAGALSALNEGNS